MFEAANLIQNEKQQCASKIDESTRLLSPSGNPGTLGYLRLDLESNENLGRDTLTSESNVAKWQIGIFLAALSGILFTANNFLIQVSIFWFHMNTTSLKTNIITIQNFSKIKKLHYTSFHNHLISLIQIVYINTYLLELFWNSS